MSAFLKYLAPLLFALFLWAPFTGAFDSHLSRMFGGELSAIRKFEFFDKGYQKERGPVVDSIYAKRVRRIYDGDTIYVDIDGWPEIIGENMPIRVARIDTPEMKGQCASEKQRAELAKKYITLHLQNAKVVELRNIERGKYFRLVAEVIADGVNVSDAMLKSGMARPYDGGTKISWCNQ